MKTVKIKLELRISKKEIIENIIWRPDIAIKPILKLPSLQRVDIFTYKVEKYTVKQIIYPWDSTKYVIETGEKIIAEIEYHYPCPLYLPFCTLHIKVSMNTIKPSFLIKKQITSKIHDLFADYLAQASSQTGL